MESGFSILAVIGLVLGAYSPIKDWLRRASPIGRITMQTEFERRAKFKPLFEQEVKTNYHENLREDVIVRDVRRRNQYPKPKPHRGISPWFKLFLVDTYHNGIMLATHGENLVYDEIIQGMRKHRADFDSGNGT